MSAWSGIDEAVADFEDRRRQALEEARQRSLELARLRAPRPIQAPLVVVAKHEYDVIRTVMETTGIVRYQPGCSCGWTSSRAFYVPAMAQTWWKNRHAKSVSA